MATAVVAIPGPQGGLWIYIAGPLIGGVLGGLLYERSIGRMLADARDGQPGEIRGNG